MAGKNISLVSGSIGSDKVVYNESLTNIDPAKLTPEQRVALAAAERNDYSIANGQLTVTSRRPLNILLNGGSLMATATAENGTKGNVYLASEDDILLNKVDSLAAMNTSDAEVGDIRIKSAKSIYGLDKTATADTVHVGGVNVLLEAGSGTIGEGSKEEADKKKHSEKIVLSTKRAVTARSGQSMKLEHTGKLFVDSLYTPGHMDVSAKNGVQLAYQSDGNTSIVAGSLDMKNTAGNTAAAVPPTGGTVPTTMAGAPAAGEDTIGTKENPLTLYTGDGAKAQSNTDIYLKGSASGLSLDTVDAGSHKVIIDGNQGDVLSNGADKKADIIAKEVSITNAANIGIRDTRIPTVDAAGKTTYSITKAGTPVKIATDSVLAEATGDINLLSVAAASEKDSSYVTDSSIKVQHIIADAAKLVTEKGSILKDMDYAAASSQNFSGVRAHDIALLANGSESDIGAKNAIDPLDSSSWLYLDPLAKGEEKGITDIHAGRSIYVQSDSAIGGGEGFKADQGDLSVATTQDIKTDAMSAENGAVMVKTTGVVDVTGAVKARDDVQIISDDGISVGGGITAGTNGKGSVTLDTRKGISVQGGIQGGNETGDVSLKAAEGIAIGGNIKAGSQSGKIALEGKQDVQVDGNITAGTQGGSIDLTSSEGNVAVTGNMTGGQTGDINVKAQKDASVDGNITGAGESGNVSLTADGNVSVTGKIKGGQSGNITLAAKNDAAVNGSIEAASQSGNVFLRADGNVAVKGDIQGSKTGDIQLDARKDVKVQGNITGSTVKGDVSLQSAGNVSVQGSVKGGQHSDISIQANGNIVVDKEIKAGATTGTVDLTTGTAKGQAGSIKASSIQAQDGVKLVTQAGSTDASHTGDIHVEDVQVAKGNLQVQAASGAIQLDSIHISGQADLQARKDIKAASKDNLRVAQAASSQGQVSLAVSGADGRLQADYIDAATGFTGTADHIFAGQVIQNVNGTAPLQVELHAADGGEARDIHAGIVSSQGIIFKDLHAAEAQITADADHLQVKNGMVSHELDLTSKNGKLIAHDQSFSLGDADGLLQIGSGLNFTLDGHDISSGIDSFLFKRSSLTYDDGINSRQLGLNAVPYMAGELQEDRDAFRLGRQLSMSEIPVMAMAAQIDTTAIQAPAEELQLDTAGNIESVEGDKDKDAKASEAKNEK